MLVRVIITGQTVGGTGRSTLSVAQILGVSDTNNRRDRICSAMLFHDQRMVQVVEGDRVDVDRLLRRLAADPRLTALETLSDGPIASRLLTEPVIVCHEPAETLAKVGVQDLTRLTADNVFAMLDYRQAA